MASQNQSEVQTSGLPHEVRPVRLQYCLDFAERNAAAVAAAAVTGFCCGHYTMAVWPFKKLSWQS